jgi:class 3 adenylate cyclase
MFFWMLWLPFMGFAQADPKSLEDQLDENYGLEKLVILNQLTELYQETNNRKALKYGKQAVVIADNLFPEDSLQPLDENFYLKVDAYNLLGEARYNKEHYYDAQLSFNSALDAATKINYQDGISKAETYILRLDSIGVKSNVIKKTFRDLKIGRSIKSGSKDLVLSSTIKAAENNEESGNYFKAIANYEKAINYLTDKGEEEEIAELYRRIAENYDKAGNIPKSLEYYKLAIGEKEKHGDTTGLQASKDGIDSLHVQIEELVGREEIVVDSAEKKLELQTLDDYKMMAEESEANEDYEKSLEYYKLYNELNDKIIEDEKKQELALLEKSYQIERNLQEIQLLTQDKEIQELELQQKESEIEQQDEFRKNLSVGIALLIALAVTLYLLYVTKRRDHKKLNLAHEDLQTTQSQLLKAEKRIKTLLGQQISAEVATELMSESNDKKIERKLVCLMFLDIRGFTTFAESRKPEDIIKYQNDVFGFMIDSVYKHNGIINQFLGDGFMATFGAPVSSGNDSENAFLAAREIIQRVNEKSKKGEIPRTRIGIGLHTGKVVVGNVGTNVRKQYSITGNAVIIAARIEQLNKEYGSQLLVSEEVLQRLDSSTEKYESLGEVELKGRGKPVKLYRVM